MRKFVAVMFTVALVACGSDSKPAVQPGPSSASQDVRGQTITLVAHDSFAVSDTVLKEFSDRTGITVTVVKGGDAGRGREPGDPHEGPSAGRRALRHRQHAAEQGPRQRLVRAVHSPELSAIDSSFDLDSSQHRVTPIDESDVCLNYDKRVVTPTSLDDLKKPEFKDKVVVENPATSSTGPRLPARDGGEVRPGPLPRLLAGAEGQRREGRRRLGPGLQQRLHLGERRDRHEERRGLLRHESARRRGLRFSAEGERPTSVSSTMRATARSSSSACSRARRTPRPRTPSSTSCCRRHSRKTCR